MLEDTVTGSVFGDGDPIVFLDGGVLFDLVFNSGKGFDSFKECVLADNNVAVHLKTNSMAGWEEVQKC